MRFVPQKYLLFSTLQNIILKITKKISHPLSSIDEAAPEPTPPKGRSSTISGCLSGFGIAAF